MRPDSETASPTRFAPGETPRPRLAADFYRAHGLGNDYLVFEAGDAWSAEVEAVTSVCDRWRGVGADGIVCRVGRRDDGSHRLRMFNPDGSEFERSGNGLRVFAAFLASRDEVEEGKPFSVYVGGDLVEMTVVGSMDAGYDVRVRMGRARVGPEAVGADRGKMTEGGEIPREVRGELDVTLVSVGNPHCVHFAPQPDLETLRDLGPFLSGHPAFPAGVNVQVVGVEGPGRLRVLVWERGVGETSASGTSACAAAVAAVSRGLVEPGPVAVQMTGGILEVDVSNELRVHLRGPVGEICTGRLTDRFCQALGGDG